MSPNNHQKVIARSPPRGAPLIQLGSESHPRRLPPARSHQKVIPGGSPRPEVIKKSSKSHHKVIKKSSRGRKCPPRSLPPAQPGSESPPRRPPMAHLGSESPPGSPPLIHAGSESLPRSSPLVQLLFAKSSPEAPPRRHDPTVLPTSHQMVTALLKTSSPKFSSDQTRFEKSSPGPPRIPVHFTVFSPETTQDRVEVTGSVGSARAMEFVGSARTSG